MSSDRTKKVCLWMIIYISPTWNVYCHKLSGNINSTQGKWEFKFFHYSKELLISTLKYALFKLSAYIFAIIIWMTFLFFLLYYSLSVSFSSHFISWFIHSPLGSFENRKEMYEHNPPLPTKNIQMRQNPKTKMKRNNKNKNKNNKNYVQYLF